MKIGFLQKYKIYPSQSGGQLAIFRLQDSFDILQAKIACHADFQYLEAISKLINAQSANK